MIVLCKTKKNLPFRNSRLEWTELCQTRTIESTIRLDFSEATSYSRIFLPRKRLLSVSPLGDNQRCAVNGDGIIRNDNRVRMNCRWLILLLARCLNELEIANSCIFFHCIRKLESLQKIVRCNNQTDIDTIFNPSNSVRLYVIFKRIDFVSMTFFSSKYNIPWVCTASHPAELFGALKNTTKPLSEKTSWLQN